MKVSKRAWLATGIAVAALGLSAVVGAPANATGACPGPATALTGPNGTICQVFFGGAQSGSFAIPSGVTAVSAIAIGGGGGGSYNYVSPYQKSAGGGGGSVNAVTSSALPTSGSISFTVGGHGTSTNTTLTLAATQTGTAGGDTLINSATAAIGGSGGALTVTGTSFVATGGASGNHSGHSSQSYPISSGAASASGGGAGGAATSSAGGAGLAPSAVFASTVDAALWPASLDNTLDQMISPSNTYGIGGDTNVGNVGDYWGMGAASYGYNAQDGAVAFRFLPPSSSGGGGSSSGGSTDAAGLATTGANVATPLAFAGILALAGIGALVARRRTNSK